MVAILNSMVAIAGLGAHALPDPPELRDIGEIMFDRRDGFGNGDREAAFTQNDLELFFRRGKFYNDPAKIGEIANVAPAKNAEGGKILATGHFATKDGRIFSWERINPYILRISDVNHRPGYLLLPEAFKKESSSAPLHDGE